MQCACMLCLPACPAGAQEAVRDCLAAAHFLRNETQAARTAVEALDKYILKLASFQDKAMEVIEEAHRWVQGRCRTCPC